MITRRFLAVGTAVFLLAPGAQARQPEPGAGAEVWLGDMLAVTYRARVEGDWLVVEATHEPGWHTYAMDNETRAREKTGKAKPETELPTVITAVEGLSVEGPWRQSPPIDLSTPDIRWFTWGFEGRSYFAAPVASTGSAATVRIDAQACTKDLCAMVDGLNVPVESAAADGDHWVAPETLAVVTGSGEN